MSLGGEVAIGLDIGGTNIKSGIVNENGVVVHRLSLPTKAHEGGEALLIRISEMVKELEKYAIDHGWTVKGVGVGTAGQVDSRLGVVMGATANLPGWAGMELVNRLQALTGLSVTIDNDANAMAYGEAWVGSGRHWHDFICVTLGTGVGGCVIIDRQPYHGRDGFAGEVGHHVIDLGGQPCNCGRTGCWEQYASVTGLMRMVKEEGLGLRELNSPEALFDHAKEGNEQALHVLRRYSQYIAVGLANLIHIFNPEGIVIGGAISKQGDFLLDQVRYELTRYLLPVYGVKSRGIDLVSATLGNDGGVVGAMAGYFI